MNEGGIWVSMGVGPGADADVAAGVDVAKCVPKRFLVVTAQPCGAP